MPEDDIEGEPFTVISIDSLFVYENEDNLQVHLDDRPYEIIDKPMKIILVEIFLELMAISFR